MNRFLKMLPLVALLVLIGNATGLAQTQPVRTTLSSAQTDPSVCSGAQCTLVLGSATGITVSTTSLQSYCLVDQELEQLVSVSGTTFVVRRARQGAGVAHASGQQAFCGYSGTFNSRTGTISTVIGSPAVGASVTGATFVSTLPAGSCTRSSNSILPVFMITALPTGAGGSYGYTIDCLNGVWQAGTLPDFPNPTPLILACNVPIGSVAYSSVGTNTTDIAGQEWLSSIMIPKTAYVTGIQFLQGGTATTDNTYVILRDSGGTLLHNSNNVGVVLSGANTFQKQAFVTTAGTGASTTAQAKLLVGPAQYAISVVGNGTTAGSLQTIPASTFVDVITGSASGTFSTITSTFTMPTTFTATKGPVGCIYY